jgi:hypothetical protein
MAHWEEVEDIRHRFSLKLAQQLDEQKIGVHEAGKIIFDFNALLKEKGDCDEVREFIDKM